MVGAVCSSAASTDLCGGRQVTGVPTATAEIERNLGHTYPPEIIKIGPQIGHVQLSHRQQTTRV